MRAEILAVGKPNITVAYKEINLNNISRDQLRKLIPPHEPVVEDIPDRGLIYIFPDAGPLICTIDKRRVRAESETIEYVEQVVKLAVGANRIVRKSHELIAYGFNYKWVLAVHDCAPVEFITYMFLKDPESLSKKLGGEVASSKFTILAKRNGNHILFDISISDQNLIFGANMHYANPDRFPTAISLNKAFIKYDGYHYSAFKVYERIKPT